MGPVKKCPACEKFASTSFSCIVSHLKKKHGFKDNTKLFCKFEACGKEVNSLLELCEHFQKHEEYSSHCNCFKCKCFASSSRNSAMAESDGASGSASSTKDNNVPVSSKLTAQQSVTPPQEDQFFIHPGFDIDEMDSDFEIDLSYAQVDPSSAETNIP